MTRLQLGLGLESWFGISWFLETFTILSIAMSMLKDWTNLRNAYAISSADKPFMYGLF